MKAVFYLGSHQTNWLPNVEVRLFISHRRLAQRKVLPKARTGWALDSGGFSELSLYGGWRTSPEEYVAAIRRYDREIGKLEWAAPQDLMTEPAMLARTGLTVLDHQRMTVANFVLLEQLWARDEWSDCPIQPTLQGQTVADYLRCWDMYGEAGVDLSNYPLVGVGSVCRRQHSEEIREVMHALRDRDPLVPLHAFGVKLKGLKLFGDQIASFDSLAWSFNARKNPKLEGCSHARCSSCLKWALGWRSKIVPCGCAERGDRCLGTIGPCWQQYLWELRHQTDTAAASPADV